MEKIKTILLLVRYSTPFSIGYLVLSFLFQVYPSNPIGAQPGPLETESIFGHLSRNGKAVQLTLQTDMDELINNRMREEYQPATLSFLSRAGTETQMDVDVAPRGNYRRRICDFPPVMLNFSKTTLAEMGLKREYDKIKLVTHCKKGGEAQDHLLKEYLVYKAYNLISPKSYRVQLAKIIYKDSKDNYKDIEQFGILIEDTDELAHRIGGSECDCRNYPQDSIAVGDENSMAVFQYMIGNEDWSIPRLRNVKLIRPYDGGRLIPVPYDFDFSGFVNAPYAVPRSQLGITDIRQRLFLGFPVDETLLAETLKAFELQRSPIENLINNIEQLSHLERKKTIKYFDAFYKPKHQRKLAAEASRELSSD